MEEEVACSNPEIESTSTAAEGISLGESQTRASDFENDFTVLSQCPGHVRLSSEMEEEVACSNPEIESTSTAVEGISLGESQTRASDFENDETKDKIQSSLQAIFKLTEKNNGDLQKNVNELMDTITFVTEEDNLKKIFQSLQRIVSTLDVLPVHPSKLVPVTLAMITEISSVRAFFKDGKDRGLFVLLQSVLTASFCNLGDVVQNLLDGALQHIGDAVLRGDASSVRTQFTKSQAYLKGMVGKKLTEMEVSTMASNVFVFQGIDFMGKLAQRIKESSIIDDSTKDQIRICHTVLRLVDLYCQLAILRDGILWQMYSLIKTAKQSENVESSVAEVIADQEQEDTMIIRFLIQPEPKQALVSVLFNPSEHDLTTRFMKARGLQVPDLSFLSDSPIVMSISNTAKAFMSSMPGNYGHILLCSDDAEGKDEFILDQLFPGQNIDNYFYMRSGKRPDQYVYMPSLPLNTTDIKGRGNKSRQGKGTWKIVILKNGKYVMSPKLWPEKFVCGYISSAVNPLRVVSITGNVGHRNFTPDEFCQWDFVAKNLTK